VIVCTAGITMTTPPNRSGHRSGQTAWRPTTRDHATTNGDGPNESVDLKVRSTERRRRPPPAASDGCLRELPALTLLDRLPIPMLAVRLDGVVFYTNPALATMLGHQSDTISLIGQRLPELLAEHAATPPRDFVAALLAAGTMVVDWFHAEGLPVRSVISGTAFIRAADQIVLIGATDITELMWSIQPEPR
jgi:PAS domain-containing protein